MLRATFALGLITTGLLQVAAERRSPAPPASAAHPVLVFSKTASFRHDSIPTGIACLKELAEKSDGTIRFTIDATEDSAVFTKDGLAKYDAVVFLSTTGDVLNDEQQKAFEAWFKGGKGYVGIHAAADTEHTWPWYGNLVGAWFKTHPPPQKATVIVEDRAHPTTSMLPERWLKNAYTELRAAFETLDGRMQISFILALYDEHTGTLYHINAEHPTAILVRGNQPQFMQNMRVGAKLGSGREADYLDIDVLALSAGDSVYFGSDGKDDILLAQKGHEQIFNDDEKFFLRKITESAGRVEEIFRLSSEGGTIIDDYSLLKLQVQAIPARTEENQVELRQQLATLGATATTKIDSLYFRKALKRLVAAKDYAHAFALAETAVREYPLETQFILAAAYAAGKIGLHDRAVDYGESLVLRGSVDAQVALILARSYLSLGQLMRSRHYYDMLPESLKWLWREETK